MKTLESRIQRLEQKPGNALITLADEHLRRIGNAFIWSRLPDTGIDATHMTDTELQAAVDDLVAPMNMTGWNLDVDERRKLRRFLAAVRQLDQVAHARC